MGVCRSAFCFHDKLRDAHGVDSWQALQLASNWQRNCCNTSFRMEAGYSGRKTASRFSSRSYLPSALPPSELSCLFELGSGSRDQCLRRDLQSSRDSEQAFQRWLPLAAFKHPDERPIQLRGVGETFL
jgi:hypothetical protein